MDWDDIRAQLLWLHDFKIDTIAVNIQYTYVTTWFYRYIVDDIKKDMWM